MGLPMRKSPRVLSRAPVKYGDRDAADEDGQNDSCPLLTGKHKFQVDVPDTPRFGVLH